MWMIRAVSKRDLAVQTFPATYGGFIDNRVADVPDYIYYRLGPVLTEIDAILVCKLFNAYNEFWDFEEFNDSIPHQTEWKIKGEQSEYGQETD